MTGAIAPDHRPLLPSTHVSVPAYWTAMASYLNRSAPPGNLLVLPEDDFYQMPYTWGYYGADSFITDLIARNVVDPVAQGYAPASQELTGAVRLVQQGLLAHDWPSVRRTLAAIGTPLLLVRGDVNAAFPGRHITPPAALDRALREDKGMRLVHRVGKLELFALRGRISPAGSVTSYATVNSATPDLRDLALLPSGTALISSPMRPAVPAVLQVPPVSQWRLAGDKLETSVIEPPGRRYRIKLLSATGAFEQPGASAVPGRRASDGPSRRLRGILPGSSPASAIATARWSKSSATSWAVPCSATATSRLARGAQWELCGVSRDGSDGAAGCACPTRTGPGGTAGARALRESGQCVRGALAGLAVRTALREPLGPQRQRSCTADVPLADAYQEVRRHVAAPAELSPFPVVPLPGDRDA